MSTWGSSGPRYDPPRSLVEVPGKMEERKGRVIHAVCGLKNLGPTFTNGIESIQGSGSRPPAMRDVKSIEDGAVCHGCRDTHIYHGR